MLFIFFQAEDGIRDGHVTGVQTCALPILYQHRYAYEILLVDQPDALFINDVKSIIRQFITEGILYSKAQERLTRVRRSCALDRKCTRLNSSHVAISYAVFCLKNQK